MKIENSTLSKTMKKYPGQWLALDPKNQKVVAFGNTPAQVLEAAQDKGISNPLLLKAPISEDTYIV